MASLTLHIEGMSCGHCLNAVTKALTALPGVSVKSVTIGRADVEFDAGSMDADRIAAAVEDAGYPASPSSGVG